MATLTNEQIEQKKQQLKQLAEEVKQLHDELVEAGAIALGSPLATKGTQELSEDDLDKAAGGKIWINPKLHPDKLSGYNGQANPGSIIESIKL